MNGETVKQEEKRPMPEGAVRTSRKVCGQCRYSKVFSSGNEQYCDYLLMAKRRRNCPQEWCDKYEPRKRRKRTKK